MKKIVFSVMILGLWSCTKRVTCEGVLYSRHGIPIPNVSVYLNVYGSASSYPTSSRTSRTDKDGNFYFYELVNKKYPMELYCINDSGSVRKRLGKPADRTKIRENITLH